MPIAKDYAPTLTGMHVLISGNVVDGLTIYGPFKTGEDAIQYGHQRGDRYGDDSWCIAPLAAPDEEEEGAELDEMFPALAWPTFSASYRFANDAGEPDSWGVTFSSPDMDGARAYADGEFKRLHPHASKVDSTISLID